jgi:hypothetical protein
MYGLYPDCEGHSRMFQRRGKVKKELKGKGIPIKE